MKCGMTQKEARFDGYKIRIGGRCVLLFRSVNIHKHLKKPIEIWQQRVYSVENYSKGGVVVATDKFFFYFYFFTKGCPHPVHSGR